jgi:hypothetical protein
MLLATPGQNHFRSTDWTQGWDPTRGRTARLGWPGWGEPALRGGRDAPLRRPQSSSRGEVGWTLRKQRLISGKNGKLTDVPSDVITWHNIILKKTNIGWLWRECVQTQRVDISLDLRWTRCRMPVCADLFLPGCICFIFNVFHFYHFFQRARKCMLHAIDSSFRKEKIGIDRCSNVEHKLIKIFFFHSMHWLVITTNLCVHLDFFSILTFFN